MKPPAHLIATGRQRASSALYALDSGCSRDEWVQILMAAEAAGISLEEIKKWSAPAQNFHSDRERAQAIRKQFGLSQSQMAAFLNVSKRTLENWERRRQGPMGPAQTLLRIMEREPRAVLRALRA